MKRIVVICRTGDSGVTDYSFCLLQELRKKFLVEFLSAPSALSHPACSGINVIPVFGKFRYVLFDILKMLFYVLRNKPDLVLFQSWISFPLIDCLVARVLSISGCRLAITAHDLLPHHPAPWSRITARLFFNSFSLVVVHSSSASRLLRDLGVKVDAVVIPHGVYSVFSTHNVDQISSRAELCLSTEEVVVLFFGHLDARKGLIEYARVASKFRGRGVRFLAAGRNDLARDEFIKIKSLPDDSLRIDEGHVPFERVQDYFAAADLVALPYREGTTSGVAKIAIAFSKPIVCTDVGDLPEILECWPGIMFSSGNVEAGLEAAIEQFLLRREDFARAALIGGNAFGWESIGVKYSEALASVVA